MDDIVFENVTKSFGNKTALRSLSVVFPGGKPSAVMGASGSGKTTMLRLIAGLDKPSSGSISVPKDKIAAVFQDDLLIGSFTPQKNIAFAVGKSSEKDEISAHLCELGLGSDLNKKCDELSGGMRRRVAIARAVLAKPGILLLDEPFKGLDETTRVSVIDYVREHTAGKTVILVTHDISDAEHFGIPDAEIIKIG